MREASPRRLNILRKNFYKAQKQAIVTNVLIKFYKNRNKSWVTINKKLRIVVTTTVVLPQVTREKEQLGRCHGIDNILILGQVVGSQVFSILLCFITIYMAVYISFMFNKLMESLKKILKQNRSMETCKWKWFFLKKGREEIVQELMGDKVMGERC